MKQHIFSALKLTLACLLVFSGGYTLLVLAIAQAMPYNGNGETVWLKGKKTGYALEGQYFSQDRYFWGRPSAVGYNAAGSGGSNKGTSNADYLKQVQDRVDTFLQHHPGIKVKDIPSELVTASGSGLDPDISPDAAAIQVKRVATARKTDEKSIYALIAQNTRRPFLGLFGTSCVNVLQLNIALDTAGTNKPQ